MSHAIEGLELPILLRARRAPRPVHERWCAYPIAPREWCGAAESHHDPDLFIMVDAGVSDQDPPGVSLPQAPRRGSRLILVDVSICTQADLDRR